MFRVVDLARDSHTVPRKRVYTKRSSTRSASSLAAAVSGVGEREGGLEGGMLRRRGVLERIVISSSLV